LSAAARTTRRLLPAAALGRNTRLRLRLLLVADCVEGAAWNKDSVQSQLQKWVLLFLLFVVALVFVGGQQQAIVASLSNALQ
jgi:hypothetical protein